MHLLNATTKRLETYLDDTERPPYAILSHTWGNEEVTFQDIADLERASAKEGYQKIEQTCRQALSDGWSHVWIDTCCIDKSSSAELSEAINSMFAWYRQSAICYAFLSDFEGSLDSDQPREMLLRAVSDSKLMAEISDEKDSADDREQLHMENVRQSLSQSSRAFLSSRWFTRGWTLQELLAPNNLRFYNRDWHPIGDFGHNVATASLEHESFVLLTALATRISVSVLLRHTDVSQLSVAKRMSWAATRKTTRPEDEAYCLLGLFNVNMPLLYGEGTRAFQRLQEEIAKVSSDQSLFAWHRTPQYNSPLLASSTYCFRKSGIITQQSQLASKGRGKGEYLKTKEGIDISLRVIFAGSKFGTVVGILDCFQENDRDVFFALRLQTLNGEHPDKCQRFTVDGSELIRLSAKEQRTPHRNVTLQASAFDESSRLYVRFFEWLPPSTAQRRELAASRGDRLVWNARVQSFHPMYEWDRDSMSCTLSTHSGPRNLVQKLSAGDTWTSPEIDPGRDPREVRWSGLEIGVSFRNISPVKVNETREWSVQVLFQPCNAIGDFPVPLIRLAGSETLQKCCETGEGTVSYVYLDENYEMLAMAQLLQSEHCTTLAISLGFRRSLRGTLQQINELGLARLIFRGFVTLFRQPRRLIEVAKHRSKVEAVYEAKRHDRAHQGSVDYALGFSETIEPRKFRRKAGTPAAMVLFRRDWDEMLARASWHRSNRRQIWKDVWRVCVASISALKE